MPARSRAFRAAVIAVSAALAGAGLAGVPATASAPSSAITVLLKTPDQAGLDRLATATGLTHAQRVNALTQVLPSAAARTAVAHALEAEGFRIDHETAWTIDATAAQPTITRMFGINRTAVASDRTAPTGVLPDLPANLAGLVAAVLPADGAPTLFHPMACGSCHNGADFRNAYTGVDDNPPSGERVGAGATNSGVTIATLQFANWNSSDLTRYATNTHAPLGDPVASGQFVPVATGKTVLGGATKSENGADEEVDLDQESILSTDPYANQRAYFNTDSTRGYVDNLSQVLADVTQGAGAYHGGDRHIVALSTSWGACESEFTLNFPGDTIRAIENLLKSLNAAGVTVFAASGDDGVYDCGLGRASTKVAVDYPASSPEVVAVGGTHLSAPGGRAANTGSNWAERAWTCSGTVACEAASGTGGSGGGESNKFDLPRYQDEGIGKHRFTTTTGRKGNFGTQPHRMVPDISADADPNTGFLVLTSDPVDACRNVVLLCNPTANPVTFPIGGTSLASPVSAALLTNLLSEKGRTSGVGDLHAQLYSAYADKNDGAFRDITAGRNGRQADVDARAHPKVTRKHKHPKPTAAELPVTAQKGYDTVTGLGAALWPRIAGFIFHPKPPRGTGSITLAHRHGAKNKNKVRVRWSYRQRGAYGILGKTAKVVVNKIGSSKPVFSRAKAPATGSHTFTAKAGGDYVLTVTPTDLTGEAGITASKTLLVPLDEQRFHYSAGWTKRPSSAGFGGTIEITSTRHAVAKATATGRTYSLGVRTGPKYGILDVFKGKSLQASIDLYSRKIGHKIVTFTGSPEAPLKRRHFRFAYTGRKDPASRGRTVDVDALYVARD